MCCILLIITCEADFGCGGGGGEKEGGAAFLRTREGGRVKSMRRVSACRRFGERGWGDKINSGPCEEHAGRSCHA